MDELLNKIIEDLETSASFNSNDPFAEHAEKDFNDKAVNFKLRLNGEMKLRHEIGEYKDIIKDAEEKIKAAKEKALAKGYAKMVKAETRAQLAPTKAEYIKLHGLTAFEDDCRLAKLKETFTWNTNIG